MLPLEENKTKTFHYRINIPTSYLCCVQHIHAPTKIVKRAGVVALLERKAFWIHREPALSACYGLFGVSLWTTLKYSCLICYMYIYKNKTTSSTIQNSTGRSRHGLNQPLSNIFSSYPKLHTPFPLVSHKTTAAISAPITLRKWLGQWPSQKMVHHKLSVTGATAGAVESMLVSQDMQHLTAIQLKHKARSHFLKPVFQLGYLITKKYK